MHKSNSAYHYMRSFAYYDSVGGLGSGLNQNKCHKKLNNHKSLEPDISEMGCPALCNKKEREVYIMDKVKVTFFAVLSALMSWLGILAVPVFLLVGCNIVDYITGLLAAPYRGDGQISSYKGIKGIIKKVCLWLLVLVGSCVDILINYAVECAGVDISIPFVVSTAVAVWLIVNEIISILENIIDIGVDIPPFLLPIVKYIKKKTEEKANILEMEDDENE